jgi:glycine/D-amino acid oxidase-like deaminating enzyme
MPDVTIVGRGLAGAVLCEVLRERGLTVRVFDDPRSGRASRVAAGIVNPMVLRRIVPSWRVVDLLPVAEDFYRRLEQHYGVKLWHPLPLVKLFSNEQERNEWERKCDDPQAGTFLSMDLPRGADPNGLVAPFGAGTVARCAWFDVPAFLDAQRDRMLHDGTLIERAFTDDELRTTRNEVVIHTTGPFASHPLLVPVKGEVLTVRIPGLDPGAIINRGAFLLPLGGELFKLGATFAWDDAWSGPTQQAREELLQRLARMTPLSAEVIDHQAGVRPASRDRRPIIGTGIFNGLGSRGVLLAPWCAMHLADHLLSGKPLDPEVDASRSLTGRT